MDRGVVADSDKMLRHGLFEITVTSLGIGALPEYDDPNPAKELAGLRGPAVVKYIEATAGTGFFLDLTMNPELRFELEHDHCVAFKLEADGRKVSTRSVQMKYIGAQGHKARISGRRYLDEEGKWQQQDLIFGALNLVEARDGQGPEAEGIDTIGKLSGTVWRRKRIETAEDRRSDEPAFPNSQSEISESTLKGQTQDLRTTLTKPVEIKHRNIHASRNIDKQPLLTVIFKYRTKHGLQSGGVIEFEGLPAQSTPRNHQSNVSGVTTSKDLQPSEDTAPRVAVKLEPDARNPLKRKHESEEALVARESANVSSQSYLQESFKKMRREIEEFAINGISSPKRLENQKTGILRKLDFLQGEMLAKGSEDSDGDPDIKDEPTSSGGPATTSNIMQISDDED